MYTCVCMREREGQREGEIKKANSKYGKGLITGQSG